MRAGKQEQGGGLGIARESFRCPYEHVSTGSRFVCRRPRRLCSGLCYCKWTAASLDYFPLAVGASGQRRYWLLARLQWRSCRRKRVAFVQTVPEAGPIGLPRGVENEWWPVVQGGSV